MRLSLRRIRAMFRKELRDYRRSVLMITSVAIFPLVFLIQPLILIFVLPASTAVEISHRHLLLYMLAIPVLTPAMFAAFAVAGERQQGTLEPVLTTPIRAEEVLLGKALAALLPSVAISYGVYIFFIACVELFARGGIAPALIQGPDVLAQLVYTPLLAGCSIWIGLAISIRSNEVRTAQLLSMGATMPIAVAIAFIAVFEPIPLTLPLAVGVGTLLLVVDAFGWRILSATFNRERLITGTK